MMGGAEDVVRRAIKRTRLLTGIACAGLMASLLGPVGAVVFGGAAAIGITIAWSRLFPELRLAKTFDPPDIVNLEPDKGATQP